MIHSGQKPYRIHITMTNAIEKKKLFILTKGRDNIQANKRQTNKVEGRQNFHEIWRLYDISKQN
ncbi:CLUMA_CG000799, isoform A [Clunio marinus]|uniref:CLUMA_CG000799, isoform A n=1 Tax=Clunio marinus TaxID=568069 RepID=A0A1J1HHF2_9DIPT|nr:CLUMA_CG000799, isoform A [Clunio marinus]